MSGLLEDLVFLNPPTPESQPDENMNKFITWWYHQKAKRKLIRDKTEDIAVFRILEGFLTQTVLDGAQQRRQELGEMQKRIKEIEEFLAFIKKIK